MSATAADTAGPSFTILCRGLKLPTVARHGEVARLAERQGRTFERYLHHLVELETHEQSRAGRESSATSKSRTCRLIRHWQRSPRREFRRRFSKSCRVSAKVGGFVERGDNLLAFGLPGRGETHLACAIGHELIHRGYRVLFTPTYALVQRLFAAKRDLRLERELAALRGQSSWRSDATLVLPLRSAEKLD